MATRPTKISRRRVNAGCKKPTCVSVRGSFWCERASTSETANNDPLTAGEHELEEHAWVCVSDRMS